MLRLPLNFRSDLIQRTRPCLVLTVMRRSIIIFYFDQLTKKLFSAVRLRRKVSTCSGSCIRTEGKATEDVCPFYYKRAGNSQFRVYHRSSEPLYGGSSRML